MPPVAIIGLALSLVEKLIPFISGLRNTLKQTGEWTAEEEAAIDARVNALMSSDAWQTDADRGEG